MRMLSKILAGAGAAAAMVALTAGTALADPPSGVTPRNSDVVGVGSDTTQFVYDQLSHDYNNTHKTATSKLYSWDAVPLGSMITTKAGCAPIVRPTGSGAGIAALNANTTVSGGTGFCIDYARSSRFRSTEPQCTVSGGNCFVSLAGDAVTWASRSSAAGGTNAPASLTLDQLQDIYLCQTTNWSSVGGSSGTIKAFLPQSSSGTRAFFLLALGGGTTPLTPGSCVLTDSNTLIENEGVAPSLNDPNTIFPYSVADYIEQVYHSAHCSMADCSYPGTPTCTPVSPENLFGCDLHGVLTLNEIQGTKPTSPWPLPAPPVPPAVNGKVLISKLFDSLFQRTVYTVVRADLTTPDHIPAYLEPFFASAGAATPGWVCSNAKAKTDIKAYGFLPLSSCGTAS